uniref:epididymal-specific lipocalin-5-like n=1 Tax=Halichoerus grypus TaxID=9711 RepID=UPI0016598A7C|nr:epididymal-specific lipocalin-5-like [Halichoerus grypus]
MKGRVLMALLGLYVVLVAGTQDPILKDFDFAKFSGLWYEIAFAVKLEPQGSPPKETKVGAVVVELEDSHLALTAAYEDEGRCMKEKSQALKGDVPGKFKIPKKAGTKEVLVLATDYKTYAIMDIVFHNEGAAHRVLKLYSRTLEIKEEVMKRFHEVAGEYGLSGKDMYLLTWDRRRAKLLKEVSLALGCAEPPKLSLPT